MDFTDALKAGGASATIILIVGIAVKVIQLACNHRIKSECCGHKGTIGIGVEEMTPEKESKQGAFPPAPTTPAQRASATATETGPDPIRV